MNAAQPVIVGYDASTEAKFAVRWASKVAHQRETDLVVVTASGRQAHELSWARMRAGISSSMSAQAQEIADEGARLAEAFGARRVRAEAVATGAVAALVDLSERAQLVVVGDKGRGRLETAFVGSTSYSVAQHAHCPVAVTKSRLNELPSAELPTVVGIDGSHHSLVALEQTAQWAQSYGNAMRGVVAWNRHSSLVEDSADSAAEQARHIAEQAEEHLREKHPSVSFEVVVREGRPAQVLAAESEHASLLIVGARGLGDFASLLIGSVSREVIHRAQCPVYIIR